MSPLNQTPGNSVVFDIHVHTSISPCSVLPLADILAHARGLGLDGVCVTDHNTMAVAGQLREGVQKDGLVVLVGMEYSTPDGQFLLFGPFEDLRQGLGARKLLEIVDERGGAAVAAHPFRMIRPVARHLLAGGLCHALETVNGGNTHAENQLAMEAAKCLGLPGIGASDAHALPALGRAATVIEAKIETRDDLVRAIRAGNVQPLNGCLQQK